MITIGFTEYEPCKYYTCDNCRYRYGYGCVYEIVEGKKALKIIMNGDKK